MKLTDYELATLPFMDEELLHLVLSSQPNPKEWNDLYELETLERDLSRESKPNYVVEVDDIVTGRLLELKLSLDYHGFLELSGKLKITKGCGKGTYTYWKLSSKTAQERSVMQDFLNEWLKESRDYRFNVEEIQNTVDEIKTRYKRKILEYKYLGRGIGFIPI